MDLQEKVLSRDFTLIFFFEECFKVCFKIFCSFYIDLRLILDFDLVSNYATDSKCFYLQK